MNKSKPEIHQIVCGFQRGDAISTNALRLQKIFHAWGYESEIFCPLRHITPTLRSQAMDIGEHRSRSRPENIILYHFSIGSETVGYFKGLPDRKVLVYHNITPGYFYRSLYDERAMLLEQGRRALRELAPVPELSLADSMYNASELHEAGYRNVRVLPIILDFDHLDKRTDETVIKRYSGNVKNILFVGRIVPNKRYEHLIEAFHAYKRFINKPARLLLVGSYIEMERYLSYLHNVVHELRLDDVIFTGHMVQDRLVAHFRVADLFLSMSEHEGFCIPLLEAMHFSVPVMAYAAAAVPETLGGSGVLFHEKNYFKIAEMMDLMLNDQSLREHVIARQRERLAVFNPESLERKLKGYLSQWL